MRILSKGGGMWAPKSPTHYRRVEVNALDLADTSPGWSRSSESMVTMPEWLVTMSESEKSDLKE
ncbi:MAG: hypothetical protein M0Q49_10285 [Porticoccaceae bacterium]|nr:hypothetical protein [Porticoccaceae bacterium]